MTTMTSSSASPPFHHEKIIKKILTILFAPLYINVVITYTIGTFLEPKNWECVACRADRDHSISQRFLYYSVWSAWLTIIVFVGWIFADTRNSRSQTDRNENEKSDNTLKNDDDGCKKQENSDDYDNDHVVAYPSSSPIEEGNDTSSSPPSSSRCWYQMVGSITFQLALPYVTTVFLCYIYYVLTNPPSQFINGNLCYYRGHVFVSKNVIFFNNIDDDMNMTLINVYLRLLELSDYTIHYWSAPLLWYMCMYDRQFEYNVRVPWSTILAIFQNIIVYYFITYQGMTMYCGVIFLAATGNIFVDLMFHIMFMILVNGGNCKTLSIWDDPWLIAAFISSRREELSGDDSGSCTDEERGESLL